MGYSSAKFIGTSILSVALLAVTFMWSSYLSSLKTQNGEFLGVTADREEKWRNWEAFAWEREGFQADGADGRDEREIWVWD